MMKDNEVFDAETLRDLAKERYFPDQDALDQIFENQLPGKTVEVGTSDPTGAPTVSHRLHVSMQPAYAVYDFTREALEEAPTPRIGSVSLYKLVSPEPYLRAYELARQAKLISMFLSVCLNFLSLAAVVYVALRLAGGTDSENVAGATIVAFATLALALEAKLSAVLFHHKQSLAEHSIPMDLYIPYAGTHHMIRRTKERFFILGFVSSIIGLMGLLFAPTFHESGTYIPLIYVSLCVTAICDLTVLLLVSKLRQTLGEKTLEKQVTQFVAENRWFTDEIDGTETR